MTPAWLKSLREKAEAATTGPWTSQTYASQTDPEEPYECHEEVAQPEPLGAAVTYCETTHGKPDAAYIAAANPAVVLWLLDMLDTLYGDWLEMDGDEIRPEAVEDYEKGPR